MLVVLVVGRGARGCTHIPPNSVENIMGMIVPALRILQLCSAQCHQWFP